MCNIVACQLFKIFSSPFLQSSLWLFSGGLVGRPLNFGHSSRRDFTSSFLLAAATSSHMNLSSGGRSSSASSHASRTASLASRSSSPVPSKSSSIPKSPVQTLAKLNDASAHLSASVSCGTSISQANANE